MISTREEAMFALAATTGKNYNIPKK